VLIDRFGWRAPFFVLPAFGVLNLFGLHLLLPQKRPSLAQQHSRRVNIWSSWRQLVSERTAVGMLWCGFFVNAANDAFFVVYGSWLESRFGLSLVALGMSTTVIGIAELTGEGFTALFADRLGLRKSVILGVSLSMLSYLGFLWWGHNLALALFALFFIFLTIEFTIVCSLSLSTELLPDARATMIAGYLAAAASGRVVGALIGGPIWLAGGIWATGITAAALNGLGLVFLYWGTSTNTPSDL
jgi:predicted MFS family arabinose efflux permease